MKHCKNPTLIIGLGAPVSCVENLTHSLPTNRITDSVSSQKQYPKKAEQIKLTVSGTFVWRENTRKLKLVNQKVLRRTVSRRKTLCQKPSYDGLGAANGLI